MPMFSVPEMLAHAEKKQYSLGAFVCMSQEMVAAVIQAAEVERAPAIIRIHPSVRAKTPFSVLADSVRAYANTVRVPIGLSLDHGESTADTVDAIRAGCTEVMRDAAELPFEENLAAVAEVAAIAHPLGVVVEAAVGHMPHGVVQQSTDLASIDEALALVEKAGADVLAPAVGNVHGSAHGETKAKAEIAVDLIHRLHDATRRPICLHGGSGIPEPQMKAAISAGVRLVIIYTDVVTAFNRVLLNQLTAGQIGMDVLEALVPAQAAAEQKVREKLQLFGSTGQARSLLFGEEVGVK